MKRFRVYLVGSALLAWLIIPAVSFAAPRSGASFGGRVGFRSSGSGFSGGARNYSTGRSYGGGTNVFVTPGFGWGFGMSPFGWGGGGGFGLMGSLVMLGVVGFGAVMVMRAVRRAQRGGTVLPWGQGDGSDELDDEPRVAPGRAYVYKLQIGLGRSARGIRDRLTEFASSGDTSSEAGLSQLLGQTSLELLREKASIRYGAAEAAGPMNLTNGETRMNAFALAERSRFQVERVRGADGKVRKSDAAAAANGDVLEYVLVNIVVAARTQIDELKKVDDRESLEAALQALGGLSPQALLGLEVIWTPADADDALTETDLMTTYPHLRGL